MINLINTRLYPACLLVCLNDIQAINAGSSLVHINYQYKNLEERENGLLTAMPTKHNNEKVGQEGGGGGGGG